MLKDRRNFKIDNVAVAWPFLFQPREAFGSMEYQLQISTHDEDEAAYWTENYLRVKEKGDQFIVYLNSKAADKNGKMLRPPVVVDAKVNPWDPEVLIGNGSICNIILTQRPYDLGGDRKGVSSFIDKVQVVQLKTYAPSTGLDFDVVTDIEDVF